MKTIKQAPSIDDMTLIAYRKDKRFPDGKRRVDTIDIQYTGNLIKDENLRRFYDKYDNDKHTIEEVDTYREVTHAMTGEKVLERYNVPWSCSVASEAYFCS